MGMRLSDDEFDDLVQESLGTLPKAFEPYMENVIVEVRDRPDRQLLAAEHVAIAGGRTLLGLYCGVALPNKSVSQPYDMPERIYLFKRNIESICRDRDEVVEQIRITVLHEVGHHFGMDEEDLDELGYG